MTSVGRKAKVEVIGAGVFGLWQALSLARAGFSVTLIDQSALPFEDAQSRYAGAMLSPYCEEEGAHPLVRDLGLKAIKSWASCYPDLVRQGTLIVTNARDRGELLRFGRMTAGHRQIDGQELAALEPDLGGRFHDGLYYPDEAHMVTPNAMNFLLEAVRGAGCEVQFGRQWSDAADVGTDWVVDCRGIGAQKDIAQLRGVRGERIIVRTRDLQLRRPVRLLHPRHPLYVVPWGEGLYMVGATVVESEDTSPITVRSALELLGLAYALHPTFGEAEIVDMGAGLRPSLPDNMPRVIVGGAGEKVIRVNGAYRHGFLLAPILADAVVDYLAEGAVSHPLLMAEPASS